MSFQNILEKYRSISFSERNKGGRFERLMQAFLQTYPVYKDKFAHVWLWNEFPHRGELGGRDTGIDLVAKTVDGDYWAVQCKCYDEKAIIDKPAVDSFLATSSRTFVNNEGRTTAFSTRLWICTTNNWGNGAENAIRNQNPEVKRILLSELRDAPVDWEELDKGIYGEQARAPKKTPREHQQKAIDAFHEHFRTEKRGKLIMACGTGKTFTSLKIAEKETGGKGIVLFLAPSIALVGQTLREWMAEAEYPIYPVCICSDPEVSRTKKKRDDDLDGETVVDLALPASTNAETIVRQIRNARGKHPDSLLVIFSTYQSIDVVHRVQDKLGNEPIDIVICDEAHRTTGVTLQGEEDSAFVRVHDNDWINAKKRVYMTATPRLYAEDSKKKAKDADAYLCSMDDVSMYGEEVFHIGFGEAVDKGLLADYKVLILTLNESEIPARLQAAVADKDQEINVDDVSKLIGCIKALSKNMRTDEGLLKASDPSPMHKAVAFCSSIKASKHICEIFNNFKNRYLQNLPDNEKEEMVSVTADHVDGSMGAGIREGKLSWLSSTPTDGKDCHILSNVRCLSEGVDVPSLDAVLFLSARNSQVDVVQSVGRVMRTAPGKKFGYIIIPILTPASVKPEEALNDNKRFAVVWSVLNALRAHDDRFSALVNRIDLNEKTDRIIIDSVGGSWGSDGDGTQPLPRPGTSSMALPGLSRFFYARMVEKVGDKRYWEQWAADIADIVQRYMERITRLIAVPGPHKDAFEDFLGGLQKNINPSVTQDEVVVMLAQHMITKPVFEALFENYSFVQNNPVSKSMQAMVDLLEEQALEKDTVVLTRFYESVKMRVSGITTTEGRQRTITELYDKFFRIAFPQTVEKLGIVYTPVEVVDFINRSVADILQATFGCTLSDKNVHVLDPFTGTGTFIARMISSGLIERDALPYKYEHELHANEIVLLAYYIASINIENVFHDTQGKEAEYKPFNGICLTDTFQLGETDDNTYLVTPKMQQNSDRVKAQKELPIQIIIGNPPYSVGQKSANDNAQNQSYPHLERRIAQTYVAGTSATNKNSLYDSYIKAFRWASDRLPKDQPGIIAFVTNAGWLDGNAMNGFRKCLEEEFSAIYVFNLRGNCRTSGELRRKEAGNIFGLGSRTPIAITILVRNPEHKGRALISYCDIGDYLSREEKLEILVKKRSALSSLMQWQQLHPDAHGDWLNKRNSVFASFIPLGDKEDKKNTHTFFVPLYSNGVKTGRDAWCWNYSKELLTENIANAIEFYNSEVARLSLSNIPLNKYQDNVNRDSNKFSWSTQQINDIQNKRKYSFSNDSVYTGMYRPFQKSYSYFNRQLNERVYKLPSLFPTQTSNNILICVSGIGVNKDFSCIISSRIPDLELIGKSQCFPLYYYKEKSFCEPTLIDSLNTSDSKYERKDAVTDFILERCREQYGPRTTKEDIFYYVYGLLHSRDYRTAFAADLKKMLPRLPLIERPDDFRAFSKAGRELAALHLNYEEQPAFADVTAEGAENGNFHVDKMYFPDKNDKSVIRYNSSITLKNIPLEAYEYVINGRSAIEWIMERYQVRQDKASGIVNDPNDWAKEQGKTRYVLDLLLSVITVSLETMKIVRGLPRLTFDKV